MVWIEFLICASIVVTAGIRLSRYGDAITEKTPLSGAWVGLLLLATITSLPELVTGISAVSFVHLPDLAVGIVFGSNLFNLLILGILDILYPPGPLLTAASRRNVLSAGLCALIIGIAGTGILIGNSGIDLNLGWIGLFSLLIFMTYILSVRGLAQMEKGTQVTFAEESLKYADQSLRRTLIYFAIASLCIVGSGIWLASIGDEIARVTGWEAGFVGSLFLAVISSLPELTVCVAALKLGAVDMAVADIIGSNMFNTGIVIMAADLCWRPGSILSAASLSQGIAAGIVILMTGLVISGIIFPAKRKTFRVITWQPLMLIALYLTGAWVLFAL